MSVVTKSSLLFKDSKSWGRRSSVSHSAHVQRSWVRGSTFHKNNSTAQHRLVLIKCSKLFGRK